MKFKFQKGQAVQSAHELTSYYPKKRTIKKGCQGVVLGRRYDPENQPEYLVKFKGFSLPKSLCENNIEEVNHAR